MFPEGSAFRNAGRDGWEPEPGRVQHRVSARGLADSPVLKLLRPCQALREQRQNDEQQPRRDRKPRAASAPASD